MKITAIVLNYNGYKDTLECVRSLKEQKNIRNLEIIVVDNNSTDVPSEKLSAINGIFFIQNKQNLGYSGGNNVGIKAALKRKADYVFIVNNDVILKDDCINNLIITNADIICPKIYFYPGYEFHKHLYAKNDLGKVIWYAGGTMDWNNIIGKHIGVDKIDEGQFNEEKKVDFATGAAMMVKKNVFEKIGLFDEKYFLYMEDLDFCTRASKSGFKIIFEPKAISWHKNASSSGGSGTPLQDYYFTRNRLLFALKYAKFRTKMAVIRESIINMKNPVKRKAFFDFMTFHFGKM